MKVKLIRFTTQPEKMIATAARVSRESTPLEVSFSAEEDQKLIRELRDKGHWSPFEFAEAIFFVKGVSRSCLAQLTRHRLASYMVRSMRYLKQEPEEVVVPESIQEKDFTDEYLEKINSVYNLYQKMVEAGVPKEDARFLLPIGSETSLFIRTNFREFRHIIDLRGSKEAQWEIRELAESFLEQLSKVAPTVFEDLEPEEK